MGKKKESNAIAVSSPNPNLLFSCQPDTKPFTDFKLTSYSNMTISTQQKKRKDFPRIPNRSPPFLPLPLPIPSRLQLHKSKLLQPLRKNGRIPHPRKILRRIHTERIRPRLRKNRHRLSRILNRTPIHQPELEPVKTRRANGEIREDEKGSWLVEARGGVVVGVVRGVIEMRIGYGGWVCGCGVGVWIFVDVEGGHEGFAG